MSERVATPERLPSAPDEYDVEHMNRLIGLMDQYFSMLAGRRRVLATTINASMLPTSATGLRAGEVWNDSGTLRVVT